MGHRLEVVFCKGDTKLSKAISFVSKKINRDKVQGTFIPSHVLLILDNSVIFESSTYKQDDTGAKIFEKGTRILERADVDKHVSKSTIMRTTISENCDPYLALKYVAKASNFHYSYGSIFKFLAKGHLRKDSGKPKEEYICSGLVLDAIKEPIFDNNSALRYITKKFEGIDSNAVTPLDLFLAMLEAGFNFKESKGLLC